MKKLLKLDKRLFIALITAYLIALFIYGYWDYTHTQKDIMTGIDRELYDIAATLKYVLPDDFHDRAVDPDAISIEEDKGIAEKLTRLVKETGIKYAYTIVKRNGSLFFVASDITADPETRRGTFYFYRYDEADESFFKAFDKKEPTYKTVSDQWGVVRTVMIPERSTGGVPYLACVDHDVSHVKKLLRKNLLESILTILFFLLLAVPIILTYIRLHRQYSKSLHESERRFDLAMNATRDGLWDWKLVTGEIYYSPGWKKMLGYDVDELPNDFSIWQNLTPPEDVERSWEMQRELIGGKRDRFEIEFKMKHKDGHWVDILSRAKAFFDKDGKAVRMVGTHVDITERKEAEEALRRSEERNRLILEQVDAVVWTVDGELRFTSSRGAGLQKLDLKPDQIVGQSLHSFLDADDNAPSIVALKRALKGESATYEETFGGYIWESHAHPLRDSAGTIVGGIVVSLDISEKKRAQESLAASEQKFRNIIKASPMGIHLYEMRDDEALVFKGANAASDKLLGVQHEQFIGKTIEEAFPALEATEIPQKYRDAAKTGEMWRTEQVFYREGSINGAFEVVAFQTEPGNMAAFFNEITDRKKAEIAMRESEERYRTLVEESPLGISLIGKDGDYKYVNPAFESLFGYTIDDIASGEDWFKAAFPDGNYRDEVIGTWVGDMRQAEIGKARPREYTVTCKDGTRKEISFRPVMMENLDQFVIYEDISERLRIERQLQQVQKFEAIGTLAGGIAHDFNNILMGIQGRASLISMDLDASHPHAEHITAVENYVKSAASLTRQLLGLARGGKYEVKSIDINELLKESSEMFGRTHKEILIHLKTGHPVIAVEADRGQLEQVLLNMYVNAWQAMPDGGDLYLETGYVHLENPFCEPHGIEPGRYVKISVTDTGAGMDEAIRQRVFDPFFTTKDKGRGTGLGLASAYGIIKNHGGVITVYSEIGVGTTFNIYIPGSDKAVSVNHPVHRDLEGGSETVLLIDDEDMVIEVGQALLEKLGYRVIVCKGGREALENVANRGRSIDLIILDLIMPGMDGGKVFDRIREIEPRIPIILSSGYAINGQAEKIMRRGCDGFIQKPFSISDLSNKVREVLAETTKSNQ